MSKDSYTYFRVEARELLEGLGQGILALEKGGAEKDLVARLLRLAHTLKGAARVVKQNEISESAHGMEDVLARYRDGGEQVRRDEVEHLLQLVDRCSERLAALSPAPDAAAQPASPREADEPIESIRVAVAQLDATLNDIGEAQTHLDSLHKELPLLEQRLRTTWNQADNQPNAAGRAYRSIRAGVERVERNLTRIRERTADFRLLPASTLFPALERTARDASAALHKRVELKTSGGEQALDAHVLMGLRDALIHAVRNAVAHGIETPAQRARAGKPEVGRVVVSAAKLGQRIRFRVEDDGGGLDVAAVRKAAVERGLVAADDAAALKLKDAVRLLFQGGLSTTAAASEFSGRGIGLDVVRAAAARLKGEAGLTSEPGRGTTLELTVPVAVDAVTVLAVAAGDATALVPLDAIHQVARTFDGDFTRSEQDGAFVTGDEKIPFRALESILLRSKFQPRSRRPSSVLVLHAAGARAAIGVDRLLETRSVVVRPLPSFCGAVPLVSGAAISAQGTPELVLDAPALIAAALAEPAPLAAAAPSARPSILVVDDSLTTRMLEQNILEGAGFDVDLATSGEEGLQKARERPHDLFVVDVEMPGMNGFELLRRFRSDPQLQRTPAIMVTSRGTADDRRAAAEAGAREYIVKSEFDEQHLLRVIRSLIAEAWR